MQRGHPRRSAIAPGRRLGDWIWANNGRREKLTASSLLRFLVDVTCELARGTCWSWGWEKATSRERGGRLGKS